jgi:hypothetical protein
MTTTRTSATKALIQYAPPLGRKAVGWTWPLRFLLGLVTTVAAAYAIMETFELRFCQPLRCPTMSKVWYFQREVSQPAVVFVGTSQIHYGIMPSVVAEAAESHGRPGLAGYNLGLPGADLEVSWIVTRDTVKGERRPDALVVGVWPLLMTADDPGHPDYISRYGHLGDVWGRVQAGELPATELASASFRGVETILQLPFLRTKKPIQPLRPDTLRRNHGGWWLPEDAQVAAAIPRPDWQAMLSRVGGQKPLRFADDSRPARLLRQFRDCARERGMRLIVVCPPQDHDYETLFYAPGQLAAYDEWMTSFCRREGIEYRDFRQSGEYGHADFADPVHLNAMGATKFSRRLGEYLAQD